MSDEKGKKEIDQNKSEQDKSAASNEEENSKTPPKEKSTEEKLKEGVSRFAVLTAGHEVSRYI